MNQNGHRVARGVSAAGALVVLLSAALASQVVSSGGPGGRMATLRVPIPADNGLSEAKVELGRRLFFDPVLSKDRSVSCSTCHKPELAFTDERPVAVGIFGRVGKRHSPSLVNRGLGRAQFWDGRATTLEMLALMPLRDVNEMDLPPEEAVVRLNADPSYDAAFQKAFGRTASTEDMARALASFVRVIRSENSAFDRFVAGDKTALSADQQRGLQIFRTRGNCTFCHREPTFTDEQFQNTGVAWKPNPDGSGGAFQDDGLFVVSRNERDRGRFKTPTLRDVARTAPYMHDGSLATLDEVVDFYDKGGRPNANLFPIIRPLGLSPEEKRVLVTFLESLSGDVTSTMLTRERTSPDFSGTWTLSQKSLTPASVPFWNGDSVNIVQSLGTVVVTFTNQSAMPQVQRRAYNLDGSVRRLNDRSLPAGFQQTSTKGEWRDWQLVLTATEFMPAADGTPATDEIIQVLTADSDSTLTVQITRQGSKTESWTLKLQRFDARQAPPPPPPPPNPIAARAELVDLSFRVSVSGGGPRASLSELRVPIPAGNELTEARVDLGRRLFLDPVLSRDRSVSCATCHKQDMAFADEKPLAVGIAGRVGKRHSPSLVNRGLGRMQFWDGRAATLEALALMPLRDVNEMDLPPDEAVMRLNADPSYVAAFQKAFGAPPSTEDMGRALASFVRVIRSENSPYDRFAAGDKTALTAEQQRGLQVFRTRGRCAICHSEPTFSDENFHNTGVAWRPNPEGGGGSFQDDGKSGVSRIDRERGMFKTPTLREIARTAPYMHDGSLATLEAVVDFYDKGGRPNPNLFPVIRPLNLTPEEKQALVKFLGSLSGDVTSTMLARERTSPDFAGTWAPSAAPPGTTPPSVPLWDDLPVTITQDTTFVTIATIRSRPQPLVRLLYGLNGSVVRSTDRTRPAGLQQVSTQASWRDWQLVLTTTEPVRAADGTAGKQEIVHVLTLDTPSSMTVQVTRKGEKTESWTVTYQKRDGPPR